MRNEDLPFRRHYRFRIAGIAYLAVTGFIAVAAISSQNNLLFWCLGLATAGIAVSGIVSGAGLMGVRVTRELVADSIVGSEMFIRYRVSNANRFVPAFGLIFYERPPSKKRSTCTPWTKFITRPVAFVAVIGPGQTIIAEARPHALARGTPTFVEFAVASSFPFGLATKTLRFAQRTSGLVYPKPLAVRTAVLDANLGNAERVETRTMRSSAAGEFFGLREYVSGDPLRSLAWKASARRDELVVCQYAQPTPRQTRVQLVLPADTDSALFETTLALAAGVLKQAEKKGYAFGIHAQEWGIALAPVQGKVGFSRALAALATLGMPVDERSDITNGTHKYGALPGRARSGHDEIVILVAPSRKGNPETAQASRALFADEPEVWRESLQTISRPVETLKTRAPFGHEVLTA